MSDSVCCKVGSLIEKYELNSTTRPTTDTFDEELLSRWLGKHNHSSMGYRPLTEWFNKQLLKQAYDRVGRNTMGVRVDSDYEALMGDDIVKMEMVDDLKADGIDAEDLLDDKISWSTMRNHLKQCLDGEKEKQKADTNWERESIEIAREHSKGKAEAALKSFISKGKIEDDQDIEIEVKFQLSCSECPTRVPFDVALNRNYVCPDHRSKSIEESDAIIEVEHGSDESFHWSTSVHHRQEPSFGL